MIPIRLTSVPGAVVRVHDLPGAGVPFVFIHGLGCAASCDYPAVVCSPALRGRRAVLVDLLGSGFSDRPAEFAYTVAAHAGVVHEVVEALGLPAIDLYGHSLGGAVAIDAAARLAGRVHALVLSEPNLDPGGGTFSRAIASQSEEDYQRTGHGETVRRAAADGNLVWSGAMATSYPLAVHRAATSLVRGGEPSWRTTLLGLSLPRSVLFGARSLPDDDHERLPAHGVQVGVVPEAGHSMAWENPAGLAAAIAAGSLAR